VLAGFAAARPYPRPIAHFGRVNPWGDKRDGETPMLRTIGTAASLALLLMANDATAAVHNPLIVWQGGATLTGITFGCRNGAKGLARGDMAVSVYRPQLDLREPKSSLTLIFRRAAHSFFKTTGGQMNGVGRFSGAWISARATTKRGGGAVSGIYRFVVTPATAIATTPFVTIDGRITHFGHITGCDITFKGSYSRRPN
jgi:hypothetical protein